MALTYLKKLVWVAPFASFLFGYILLDYFLSTPNLTCPNVIGLPIEQAALQLSASNLNMRIIATKEDELLAPGTVLSQTPHPGQKIKRNQNVLLAICKKPPQIKAPVCIGKSLPTIKEKLDAQHITYKWYQLPAPYPENSCFAQQPGAQSPLEGKMTLYISTGSQKPVLIPNLKNKTVAQLQEFFEKYQIKNDIRCICPFDHNCSQCIVIDQRPLTGSITENAQQLCLQVKVAPGN